MIKPICRVDKGNLFAMLAPIEEGLKRVELVFKKIQGNLSYGKAVRITQPTNHITALIPRALEGHLEYLIKDLWLHKKKS